MRIAALMVFTILQFKVGCDGCSAPKYLPAVTIDAPAEGAFINAAHQAAFEVSGTCTDIGQPVVLGGSATGEVPCSAKTWTAVLDFSAAVPGPVTLTANHRSGAGSDAPEVSRTFIKDVDAPSLTIELPVPGTLITPANQSVFVVSGTCSENGAPVVVSVGSVTQSVPCTNHLWTATLDVSSLADGSLDFQGRQTDAAGNVSAPASRAFVKAANGPGVSISSPPAGAFINAATVAAFPLAGFCTERNQPVTLSGAASGSVTCSATGQWSAALDVSSAAEGTVTIRANHRDAIGNAALEATRDFVKDTLAPTVASLTISSGSPTSNPVLSLTWGSQVGAFSEVCLLENSADVSLCTGNWLQVTALPTMFTVTTTPGVKSLTAWLRDAAGNTSAAVPSSNSVTFDTANPSVTLTSLTGGQVFLTGTTQALTWVATDTDLGATPISLSYSTDSGATWLPIPSGTGLANSGSFSWVTPTADSKTMRVRVTVTDLAGNLGSASSTTDFTLDGTAPVFTPGAMRLNAGVASTNSNYVSVEFVASDSASKVTAYCLKYNSTMQPLATDGCWLPVTPTASFVANVSFRLGFSVGTYTVSAWARNELGLISALSNGGAGTNLQDLASVTYTPVAPPLLTGVTASSSNATVNLNVAAAGSVFIKWSASSPVVGLATTPISIFSTTDDRTYTQIAAALPNAQGSGCTISGAQTGCFVWTSPFPTSSYFRIRVGAVDTLSRRSFRSSEPLNVGANLKILAGSTDPGTGGSAEAAVFISGGLPTTYGDPQTFIVSNTGTIYFNDMVRGLLKVDPTDGVQQLVIRKTGVATDGVVPGTATLRDPASIAFDTQQRVLFIDYDLIRRYDPVAGTLTTIIGGGASSALTADAGSLSIAGIASGIKNGPLLFSTPDGKIYFQAEDQYGEYLSSGYRLRVYDPATGLVTSLSFSGTGDGWDAGQNISVCKGFMMGATYDPTVVTGNALRKIIVVTDHQSSGPACTGAGMFFSVISPTTLQPTGYQPGGIDYTSMFTVGGNGDLYLGARSGAHIDRFDSVTQTVTVMVGTGTNGTCPDGTAALACPVDVSDVAADSSGNLFFYERGRIRTVEKQSGRVYTVMGASLSFGDGAEATSARVGVISDLKAWRNDGGETIVFTDNLEYRIREFASGGAIQTLAGNGTHGVPAVGTVAATQSISYANSGQLDTLYVQVDPALGTIYSSARSNQAISRIDRSTGRWSDFVGTGSTLYTMADGLPGNQISLPGYAASLLGFDGTRLMTMKYEYVNDNAADLFFKLYTASSGTQSALAGVTGVAGSVLGPDGVAGTASSVALPYPPYPSASWDAFANRWVFLHRQTPTEFRALPPGGSWSTIATVPGAAASFAYRHDASNNTLYYCDRDTGRLNKYVITGPTTGVNTVLSPWPVGNLRCSGLSMIYTARNSLLFPFQQDGVGGVAEYLTP